LAWAGKSIREYKDFKSLKRENLRDNMTNLELALNMLVEVFMAPKGVPSQISNQDRLGQALPPAQMASAMWTRSARY